MALAEIDISVSISPNKGYAGDSYTLTASWDSGAIGYFNGQIIWGDGSSESISRHPYKNISRTHVYSSPGNFSPSITISDESTAASGTGSTSVEVRSKLSVSLSSDKTAGKIPLTVEFTGSYTGGYPDYTIQLNYGDGTSDTWHLVAPATITSDHTYNVGGTYTVKLTVTDALGLSKTAQSTIKAGELIIQNIIQILLPTIAGLTLMKLSRIKK